MTKLKSAIDKILITVSSSLLVMMVSLSIWQVLARYVFNISSPGTEELTRHLLIWFGLLTAAYVFGVKKHIGILFFREKFNRKVQRAFEKVSDLIILGIASTLMVYGGLKIVLLTSAQTAAATGISMAWVYAALPTSGLFIIIYTIISLMSKDTKETEEVNG
ncbi:C4-dicarboxylate ABC transporter permease [Sutcliffiella cohnii]|uniref:C4-dicarboxylate ABC transporter permease n=1 Tax=Sutcliffiella cohnii TaxID=33932 RepID=A0A223KLB1_9BACI|nr:TRAP transporter small permease [Sutcliffiella cohnii]AST90148.1 C4-dicarboxylate ABC transporter permease [Sutcliffiella cohnii]